MEFLTSDRDRISVAPYPSLLPEAIEQKDKEIDLDIVEVEGRDAEVSPADEPFHFEVTFVGCMEMCADAARVARYFDVHQEWFQRCALPMTANPLGKNGYALTIGRFGALGYTLEPKIGLELLPQEKGVYRIRTIPIPNYTPAGYEVNFCAQQELVETEAWEENEVAVIAKRVIVTRVEWHLHLTVGVRFPRFIRAFPEPFVQKTGDRLLAAIVKQVSRVLTYKVQRDFHATLGEEALKTFQKRHVRQKHQDVCRQIENSESTNVNAI